MSKECKNVPPVLLLYCATPGVAQEADHLKNTDVLVFVHIQCKHLMYSEVAWVIVSSGTQFRPQIILDPDYLPDCLSVSCDYRV